MTRLHRALVLLLVPLLTFGAVASVVAQEEVNISHYFSGELNQDNLNTIMGNFTESSGIGVVDSPIGHEDFKAGILAGVASGVLPDVFSYWAGARVQFVVDAGALQPIGDMWDAAGLDDVVPAGVADAATLYNGERYFVPFNIHYAAFFYNPKVWAEAGIEVPDSWDGLMDAFAEFEMKGIDPIALGSKFRWPGQFWFDYLLLRTAGPDYRAALMAGDASYEDAEVVRAMEMWQELIDAGYFVDGANAYDWVDAADQVANGQAAVTLMGTWIGGYWKGQDLVPGEDYDFFDFPEIDMVPQAGVGPIDGWVMTTGADAASAGALMEFLVNDVDAQTLWNTSFGSISPNVNVDPMAYDVVAAKAGASIAAAAVYAFNYDLATTPPVAECGLDMFSAFMDDSSDIAGTLATTQACAEEGFMQ
ncbi:MAG: extracellular solute-binding protein [Anaerolineaceae bacterium]|nr:extracellular solute-binding protein [Anaerolineaceae bacterium]MCY4022367.1 extracellular solute-binding protein [Anaerolineaceae bacterium]